jgi:hypothetical protein
VLALLRWLERPRATLAIVALGVLLALPTISLGFFADDYALLADLNHQWPGGPPWWDLYRFTATTDDANLVQIGTGFLPWWSAPGLRFHFLRPLPSALFALDHRLFGDSPLGPHLHSLVWWLALLLVVRALYRRVLPGASGALALLVFAVALAHWQPYGWVCSRHMLVAAVPAMLAVLAHVRAREDGWAPGRWLAPIGLAAGLLGGEVGLSGVAFWIAYEALGPARLGSARQRLREALPALAVLVAYLGLYRRLGGGAAASGVYVDPMRAPGEFAVACATRLPVLLGNALLEVPAELSVGSPAPFVAVGLAGTLFVALLARACWESVPVEERVTLRWLVVGAAGALVIPAGGYPGGRVLLIANVGFAALIAALVRVGLAGTTWPRRAAAGVLAAIHIALMPFALLGTALYASAMARRVEAIAHAVPAEVAPATRVFVLAASDPMTSLYAMAVLASEGGHGLACWSWLSGAKAAHRVTRLDVATLAIEPMGRSMLRGPFESLYRARSIAAHVGDEMVQCGSRVRIAALDGAGPIRIEVRFDVSLDDAGLALVAWDGERLARVAPPPVGESVVLGWHVGPMGMY